MRFNKKKYRILDDVNDNGVLMSTGLREMFDRLEESERRSIEPTFAAFYKRVINNCKKGYYLSNKIAQTLAEDTNIQNKLNTLLHELKPAQGIMLLPTLAYWGFINSISYTIGRNEGMENHLMFSMGFHSERGLEMFTTGWFLESKFKALSVIANDLDFQGEKDVIIENFVNFMFNVLLFMQFAEIETVVTEGKGKDGSRVKLNDEKYLNESVIPIEIIDSNWFRRLIRTGAFKVSGHFRLQPYGKGNSLRKLVWIDEFQKLGYNLTPKVLRNSEN